MNLIELTVEEKIQLGDLALRLKEAGVSGYIETRDFVGIIFPEFESVRNAELDEAIRNIADNPEPPYRSTFEELDTADLYDDE